RNNRGLPADVAIGGGSGHNQRVTTSPLHLRSGSKWTRAIGAVRALDSGYYDPTTGLGARGRDVRFCPSEGLADVDLANLYEFDWLARKVVRAPVEDAWQDTIEIPDLADAERWSEIDRFEGSDDGAFLTAAHWGRLYGLSLLLLGFDRSGDLEQPLPSSRSEER